MKASFARTLSDGRSGVPALMKAIEAFLDDQSVPIDVQTKLMLAFDEVVSNVLVHGATQGAPSIDVSIKIGEGRVSAAVIDDGQAFDPLAAPVPDTTLPAQDRPIGGLGVLLVRELMDELSYRRESGRNLLQFTKNYAIER